MGRTACTEPQCLYKGALYLYLYFFFTYSISFEVNLTFLESPDVLIAGFRRGGNEIFAFLECYVALTGSKGPTFQGNIGPISCPETPVTNCKSTLYKIPEIQNLLFSSYEFLVLLQTPSLFFATSPFNSFYFSRLSNIS
jgi:hypothetical protein